MTEDLVDRYEYFAHVYDAIVGERQEGSQLLRRLIKKYAPECRSILEVACGTGSLLQYLHPHYQVTGLDYSKNMLLEAKEKLPDCQLYHADMRSFCIEEKFDVVLCIFDSINHLTRKTDWKKTFRCIAGHLRPGGIFIFDVNTLHKLNKLSGADPLIHDFDEDTFILHVQRKSRYQFIWQLRLFAHLQDNLFQCFEEIIPEAAYPIAEVKELLASSFFIKRVCDVDENPIKKYSERAYFVCQKRGR